MACLPKLGFRHRLAALSRWGTPLAQVYAKLIRPRSAEDFNNVRLNVYLSPLGAGGDTPMRYMWKAAWKDGEVTVEADDPMELEEGIKNLAKIEGFQDKVSLVNTNIPIGTQQPTGDEVPQMAGNTQCGNAIRTALKSDYGRRPRTIADLRSVFEQNALYYSKGTLSGMLTYMTKKGDLRRVQATDGSWGYVLNNKE